MFSLLKVIICNKCVAKYYNFLQNYYALTCLVVMSIVHIILLSLNILRFVYVYWQMLRVKVIQTSRLPYVKNIIHMRKDTKVAWKEFCKWQKSVSVETATSFSLFLLTGGNKKGLHEKRERKIKDKADLGWNSFCYWTHLWVSLANISTNWIINIIISSICSTELIIYY